MESVLYENVNTLKSQMLSIIVTQTATGILHFDTPVKGQNKDLYSAIILAAHGAKMVEREMEGEGDPILYAAGGLIRQHKPGASFDPLHRQGPATGGKLTLGSAVLTKKIK